MKAYRARRALFVHLFAFLQIAIMHWGFPVHTDSFLNRARVHELANDVFHLAPRNPWRDGLRGNPSLIRVGGLGL
jgi:hypothetical protein